MATTGLEWAQGLVDPDPYLYDDWGMRSAKPAALESLQDVVFGHGANTGSLLPHEELVHNALKQIAQQAGLPADFDWWPHLANAAMAQQQGARLYGAQGGFDIGRDNAASLAKGAVESAMQEYPQLQQALPLVQEGGPLWQQGEELRTNYWNYGKERKSDNFKQFATLAALAFGGGALLGGAGAGAGTGEAALGSGITTGAAGQTGLTLGTATGGIGGGALGSGLTAGGSAAGAGTAAAGAGALGAGYFGSETAYPVAGGATAAATGTGTATGAGTTAAGSTALQRILDGQGTTQDYISLLGTGFDIYGANKQADATKEIADRYFSMGAPYRGELARISADPQAFYDSPTAKSATESVLRRLSATHGNVAGSPYGQALTIDALYDQYGRERDRLAGFGGLTAYNSAAPGAAGSAIGAEANLYNSIGGGIADITTPRRQITLQDILRGVQV